jgi:DNA-binding Lrp family transcriptional regulator
MSPKKDHESMEKRQQILEIIQQNSPKGGIRVIEISEKVGLYRTTVYDYVNALYNRGLIESDQGRWRVSTTGQKVQPLEKEIIIKLPLPKSEVNRAVLIESTSKLFDDAPDSPIRILRDKLEETRTIRITGKNVDELDLQKISALIKQATEPSYKTKIKGLFALPKKSKNDAEKSVKKPIRE